MPPIFCTCTNCLRKSSSVKSPLANLACCFSISSVELGLDLADLLDQPHDVALAEDALGHAFGAKLFEFLQLFADADELDRNLGDFLDRQSRAAAGVAVELRQNHAIQIERIVECFGAV